MVGLGGLEPPRDYSQRILSPQRLPFRHRPMQRSFIGRAGVIFKPFNFQKRKTIHKIQNSRGNALSQGANRELFYQRAQSFVVDDVVARFDFVVEQNNRGISSAAYDDGWLGHFAYTAIGVNEDAAAHGSGAHEVETET